MVTETILMEAVALGPKPSLETIRVGLAGNLCRCTGYSAIYRSVEAAAKSGEPPRWGKGTEFAEDGKFLEGPHARTSELLWDVPSLVAYVSSVMTLLPGDVLLTGTPEGVGPLTHGDEVSVTVESIGTLTNRVTIRD